MVLDHVFVISPTQVHSARIVLAIADLKNMPVVFTHKKQAAHHLSDARRLAQFASDS